MPLAITLALLLPACGVGVGAIKRPLLREYRLVVPRAQVSEPVWLASFTTDELGGRLAPGGKRLLYAGNQKGNLDIWIKDLTTGFPRRVTSHVATDTQPAWSPDGRSLVFVSMRHDVKGDIYLWREGKLTRLTDRLTADTYPVFAPDGKVIYFASGPEGRSRIVRMSVSGGEASPVTGWGATHPAVSPDGRHLAFTRFDKNGQGIIAARSLGAKGEARDVTAPEYHAGFPAFSADGQRLVYSRFYTGPPNRPLSQDAPASLWEVSLYRAMSAKPREAQDLARPLTSGRSTALFPQVSPAGIVFTTRRAGSLDIGLLPGRGPVPNLEAPARQLALARAQDHPRDRLLCLQYVARRGARSPQASRGLYMLASLYMELGEQDKARQVLGRLIRESALTHGDFAYLAQIDAAVLPLPGQTSSRVEAAAVKSALARLEGLKLPTSPSDRVAAHLLLRRGDVQRAGGREQYAIRDYEALLSKYPQQREEAVEAKLHLGALFSRLRDPALLTEYYLTLFADFPRQQRWLRRAARAVLRLHRKPHSPMLEVERLRALMGKHGDKPLFVALAQMRVARIYERKQQLPLAIQAMHRVTVLSGVQRERTEAAFELGRMSLLYSDSLQKQGKASRALGFYDKALAAYETIVRKYEPGHEYHTRARSSYLRLSLLDGAQREREGELALAEKRYRKIIAFDPLMVQAHRKVIQFGVARGQRAALITEYEARASKDAGDFVAHYALGYLQTLARPLKEAHLDRAEEHLRRATSLNPQSPFGHMTLGWIHEMRERFLGQSYRGWLEEAILLYDRAYNLNDHELDAQTEADLLVNLCNAFANMGNGWSQAHEFCRKRWQMKRRFLSRPRKALFHLTYGRAATATGKAEEATTHLELALDQARLLGNKQLEAEVLTRVALTAHLWGKYLRSNRYFARAARYYGANGQPRRLAGIRRSMAYNLSLAGKNEEAMAMLLQSRRALDRHGTPKAMEMLRIGPPGRTVAPFGFDSLDETYVALAIRGRSFGAVGAWPEVLPLIERRITNRKQASKLRKDEELNRELVLLRNNAAMVSLTVGRRAGFRRALETALASVKAMQTPKGKGYAPTPEAFPLEVALALNSAEEALSAPAAAGRGQRLAAAATRLRGLDRQRAAMKKDNGKDPLSPRLRLSLWTDLALLYFEGGRRGLATVAGATSLPPGVTRTAAGRALDALWRKGAPLVLAVRLLRKVERITDPTRPPPEDQPSEEDAQDKGVLAPLYRPLSAAQRLRWHVLAAVDSALISAAFTPRKRLAAHPSTRRLDLLGSLCTQHELGALRFVVSAELALRRGSMGAMEAAVSGFLQRSPLLLGPEYFTRAPGVRELIFGGAVALALQGGDVKRALAFAEQRERRAFVDALASLPPAAVGRGAATIKRLLAQGATHRAVLAGQDPTLPREQRESWRKKLNVAAGKVTGALKALSRAHPRVGGLFAVPAFPHGRLQAALAPGDVAVTALINGPKDVRLVALAPGKEPAVFRLKQGRAQLVSLVRAGPKALGKALGPPLVKLTAGARRVYVDLGRIDPELRPEGLFGARPVTRLATLWELVDAARVRNLAFASGLVADPRQAVAERLARALSLRSLSGKHLRLATIDRAFERAGMLVWSGRLRFDGGGAANVRLLLHDPHRRRQGDLRLGRALGLPLRGHLLVVSDPMHTSGNTRAERVALTRLVHAMGIPSVLVLRPVPGGPFPPLGVLKHLRSRLGKESLARALAGAGARPGEAALYGHAGMPPARAKLFARKRLEQTARAGARAYLGRPQRLTATVENLETAVRLMEYLGDFKYLDGALGFMANAYGLMKDYDRALPHLERLVTVRAKAIELARARKKGVLAAQAKWVQSLLMMSGMRSRNKQYDRALKVNRQAIDLYKQVKRPLMAQPAYAQRSQVAEKKGDLEQALTYGELSLATARKLLARASKRRRARAVAAVVSAAVRLSRLHRQRFSNYGKALAAARLAMAQLPAVQPEALEELRSRGQALKQKLAAAEGKEKRALKKQYGLVLRRLKQLRGVANKRLNVSLEISRNQSARGDYRKAVAQAELALAEAKKMGSSAQSALLEVVNNLFYLGAYDASLVRAAEGLALAHKMPPSERRRADLRKIQFYNVMGSVYAVQGRSKEAIAVLGKAMKLARWLEIPAEVAASHNNLGNAFRRAGKYGKARDHFKKALAMDIKRADRLGIAFDRANLGLVEELRGRHADARASFLRARTLSREIGAPLNELKALMGLGRLDLAARAPAEAWKRSREGLAITTRLGLRNWSWRFHLLAARASRGLGQQGPALAALRKGIAVVEGRPPRPPRRPGTVKVEEEPSDLYDELIDLLAEQGQAEQALDLCERMRARSFLDLVSHNATRLPVATAATLMTAITGTQMELEAARAAAMRSSGEDRKAAQKSIRQLSEKLLSSRKALTAINPWLPSMVALDAWPLARLKPSLARLKGARVVSYYPTSRRLVIWILGGTRLTMKVVAVDRKTLAATVRDYRRALTRYHEIEDQAHKLYDWLLRPVAKALGKLPARLVVVPAGPLHVLPFAALHDGKDYAVARTTVSYLSSVNALRRYPGLAAVKRPRRVSFGWAGAGERPLRFVAREAGALQRTFPDALVVEGAAATTERFKQEAPSADLLHVATHADYHEHAPLGSTLELAGGELKLLAVLGLQLRASLVILSACQTGAGHLDGAAGVLGFHRAFLAAGAQRVVSSLWRVSDLGTALLMKRFFRQLQDRSPAEALRRAQQQLRKRYPHPAFWAGFRLDGAL